MKNRYRIRICGIRKKKRAAMTAAIAAGALLVCAAALILIFRPFSASSPGARDETPTTISNPEATPTPDAGGEEAPKMARSLYEAAVDYDAGTRTLIGGLNLTYANPSADSLYALYLRLYPNAVSEGCMSVDAVAVNGMESYYELSGGGTILMIPFAPELDPGERTVVYIEFKITVPELNDRFGAGTSGAVALGNFLPIAAIYEDSGWRLDPYVSFGDPFYSEIADYEVALTVDSGYTVACTGTQASKSEENGRIKYLFHAPEARDFAAVLIKGAHVATALSGGVAVEAYSCTGAENAQYAADTAASAVEYYAEAFGQYPYPRLCVAECGVSGGMEYPGLIMISEDMFKAAGGIGSGLIIAHEAAHQWWYAAVGSDQYGEPWVDEALTQFSSYLWYKNEYGRPAMEEAYNAGIVPYLDGSEPAMSPLSAFEEGNSYFSAVYARGADMFYSAYKALGEETFLEILRGYYSAFYMKTASGNDLLSAFGGALGE